MMTYSVFPKGIPEAATSCLPEAYARSVSGNGNDYVLMSDLDYLEAHVLKPVETWRRMDVYEMRAYVDRLDIYIKDRRTRLRVEHDGLINMAIDKWYVSQHRVDELKSAA